jgi:hypothetical protein
VTITGTNFNGVGSVTFGGVVVRSITSINDAGTQIVATSPPGTGTVDVVVSAEGGTSATSANDHFVYANPVPAVTSVAPNAGPASGGGSVTINGSGFIAGATVKFGTSTATVNTITPTAISAVVPAGSAGTVDVMVTTAAGASSTGTADHYTYSSGAGLMTPMTPTISIPGTNTFNGGFIGTVNTNGDGTRTVTTNSPEVCTVLGLVVSYVGVGTCSLTAHISQGATYAAADGAPQTFTVSAAAPSTPSISDLPGSGAFGSGFTVAVSTNGDGTKSVTSNSTGICSVSGFNVSYVGVGTCSLTAHVATGTDYTSADGTPQTFNVGKATPTAPSISNVPGAGTVGGGFIAVVLTNGDGVKSVTSSAPSVCTTSGLTVAFVGPGTCSLNAQVASSSNYTAGSGGAQTVGVTGNPPPPPPPPPNHGYWLVGSDGGIFSFGAAVFHGSTGSNKLNRPVVGITPTTSKGGYWLVASDGGIFAFGDASFFGSIPGMGLAPAGTVGGTHLNAPIVGMVPSFDGGGYFMVASDGGVFAFGDAAFEGSCPGIGGCSGAAVGVAPDASGNGYWLVTVTGHIYTFGDANNFGAPGPQSSNITSIVRTPSGNGYWILDANGEVFHYGDAGSLGSLPVNTAGGLDPAAAIFTTSDGGGYWVSTALGKVYNFGDAPADGDISGTKLNGSIIAATGF